MSTTVVQTRITDRFAELHKARRCGLMTFLTACDPDQSCCAEILKGLPRAGADFIELGVPFTDPMADGPTIQAANVRALAAGATLPKALDLVADFRKDDDATPITLMGYVNPISAYGEKEFLSDARAAGVDGVIAIDLSIEEDDGFFELESESGISCVRLATPTTDDDRLGAILEKTSGFLYYVSLTGVTGADGLVDLSVRRRVAQIKQQTDLPVSVGFGIRTRDQAASIARTADAVVVGSAIIERIAAGLANGVPQDRIAADVWQFVSNMADSIRSAR